MYIEKAHLMDEHGAIGDEQEWSAGGYVDVAALFGAMHPPRGVVRRIWFGHDDVNLYLRFDLVGAAPLELRILFSGTHDERTVALRARPAGASYELELGPVRDGAVPARPSWTGRATATDVLAFAVPFSALAQRAGESVEMVASVVKDGKPVEQFPPSGAITVRVPGDPARGRQPRLKVLFVAAEVAPFAKSGGVADVTAALAKELRRQGVDVRLSTALERVYRDRHGLHAVVGGDSLPVDAVILAVGVRAAGSALRACRTA